MTNGNNQLRKMLGVTLYPASGEKIEIAGPMIRNFSIANGIAMLTWVNEVGEETVVVNVPMAVRMGAPSGLVSPGQMLGA